MQNSSELLNFRLLGLDRGPAAVQDDVDGVFDFFVGAYQRKAVTGANCLVEPDLQLTL